MSVFERILLNRSFSVISYDRGYSLIGCDLRNLAELDDSLKDIADSSLPTLVVAECVLTYLKANECVFDI